MSFGLNNFPVNFQRTIDVVLLSVKWKFALVYIDGMIIFSRSIDDHLRHLGWVLTLISDAGFSLKLEKCFFLQQDIAYLGHVVRPHGLRIQLRTFDEVKTFKPPISLIDLQSFIGL